MGHETRIIEAFTANGIRRVLFIDDVYDPPALDEAWTAALLDHVETEDGRTAALEVGADEAQLAAAADAIQRNALGEESATKLVGDLYSAYASTRDPRFDPGGHFKNVKGTGLDVIGPVVELVRKCGDQVAIRLAGLAEGEAAYREHRPDVLFLDYFLGPDVPVVGRVTAGVLASARRESIELLKRVLADGVDAAVVLMSSRDKLDAEQYRKDAGGDRVLSVRFRFLRKTWVKIGAKRKLSISHDAADTLLDTTQGFQFGGALQGALSEWRKGAEKALASLLEEVGGLQAKDFAYLLRFRLEPEGEPMGHYLEWLFGESLRALVDESIDWKQDAIRKLDEAELSRGIEGAFDGPSVRIAKLFHRIRVNSYQHREQARHELGDLYVSDAERSIRAVVTPDCDLVSHKGRCKVTSLLTMGGTLRSFDQDSASADHFLLHANKPYGVKWNPKDLRTFPIDGAGSLDRTEGLEYAGTLRPIYAQDMQRIALADLARLGLAVSPAMGVDAKVRVFLRVNDGKGTSFRELDVPEHATATIVLGRGDAESGHLVLLRRRYLHELADVLRKVKAADLPDEDGKRLHTFLLDSREAERARGFLAKGSSIKEGGPLGTRFAIGTKPDTKKDSPWLQFLLELDDEALDELLAADPLSPVAALDGGDREANVPVPPLETPERVAPA